MGKTTLITRMSLKGQVIVTIILILVSSLVATVLTFSGIMLWGRMTGPAYRDIEGQIPQFIAHEGTHMLRVADRHNVENMLRGMPYQVLNEQGRIQYGSIHDPILHNATDLVQHINTTELQGRSPILIFDILQSSITRYFPIYNDKGTLYGGLIVRFPANRLSTYPSVQGWMTFLSYLIPIIPFLYFCLFSYLFTMQLGKRINKPLQVLVKGAERIQEQDLDFEIKSMGPSEIEQVLVAFENMRATLKDSLVRLWQMEEERRHMIASISHDLRTPVTIIQGHVESLLDGAMVKPERLERYLQTAMRNTKRVIQLIDDMQQVTVLDKPGFTLRPVAVDIRRHFLEWKRDFELLTSSQGIELQADLEDERHVAVDMVIDPERVSQILDNIVSNSIRFTPPGGTITVHMTIINHLVTYKISDTGTGFSKADIGHMFDQFYQGDSARSEAGHSGLGLYTAKTLVEKHGGTITAGNNPHGGAFVKLTIRDLVRKQDDTL